MLDQTDPPTAQELADRFGATINAACDRYSTDERGDWPGSKAREDKRKLRLRVAHELIKGADEPLADFLSAYFQTDKDCDGNSDQEDRAALLYNFHHDAPVKLAREMSVTHNCEAPV